MRNGRVTLSPQMARMLADSLPTGEAHGDVGTVVALLQRGLVLAGQDNPLTELGRRLAQKITTNTYLIVWSRSGKGDRAVCVPMEKEN